MINSSQLNILTPQKDAEEGSSTAFKQASFDFSKSELIGTIRFIHEYMEHEHVELVDLRQFNLSVQDADKISQAFQQEVVIPLSVIQLKKRAIREGYYTPFLSEYIEEEFCVNSNNSFAVIAVIHCSFANSVSVETVLTGLFNPLYSKMICHRCASGITVEERQYAAFIHNSNVYDHGHSTESNERHGEIGEEVVSDEIDFRSAYASAFSWNPFDDSSDEDERCKEKEICFSSPLNSTISFNPFDEEYSVDEHPKALVSKKIACEHCKSEFSNRNNMKQHLIRNLSQ